MDNSTKIFFGVLCVGGVLILLSKRHKFKQKLTSQTTNDFSKTVYNNVPRAITHGVPNQQLSDQLNDYAVKIKNQQPINYNAKESSH